MPVTLTIDVFSGRPNPSVVVQGLGGGRAARAAPADDVALKRKETAPFAESGLGYRGIIIHADGRRPRGVPAELQRS